MLVCLLEAAAEVAFVMLDGQGPIVRGAAGGMVCWGWWRLLEGSLGLWLLKPSWVVVMHGHGRLRACGAGL